MFSRGLFIVRNTYVVLSSVDVVKSYIVRLKVWIIGLWVSIRGSEGRIR